MQERASAQARQRNRRTADASRPEDTKTWCYTSLAIFAQTRKHGRTHANATTQQDACSVTGSLSHLLRKGLRCKTHGLSQRTPAQEVAQLTNTCKIARRSYRRWRTQPSGHQHRHVGEALKQRLSRIPWHPHRPEAAEASYTQDRAATALNDHSEIPRHHARARHGH